MKKFIIAILLLTCSTITSAQKVIEVVFGYAVVPNSQRKLIEEVNKSQNNWEFVIVTKQGAGGQISTDVVINSNKNSILLANSSFFIRANAPNTSYRISQFKLLNTQCSSPAVIVSKKYDSINAIEKAAKISIGTGGIGSTAHLLGLEVAKKYPNSIIVPYNSSAELLQSAIGNNVDIAIGFLNLWKGQIESKLVNPLGISGGESYLNIPNLEGQIAKNMVNNFFLVVNQSLDYKLYEEWKQLFKTANLELQKNDIYKSELCSPIQPSDDWLMNQQKFWLNITK
jgi:tripartite-type tricarboxylate transporter receptor subunit TctC